MNCPVCHHQDTKVVDSRVANEGMSIRRRRECIACGFRFSTFEEMDILDLTIVKRDGTLENYSREKLCRGLHRALEKRPISENDFRTLVNIIERDIQKQRKSRMESEDIGRIVLERLKDTDQVAYIRFASVYKSFEDADTFKKELNQLVKNLK